MLLISESHPCPECGKVFTKLYALRAHQKIHAKEKAIEEKIEARAAETIQRLHESS